MPVKKKEFELDDGTKIWVRQASGIEKLKISNIQAKVFRSFTDKGDPSEWSEEKAIVFQRGFLMAQWYYPKKSSP